MSQEPAVTRAVEEIRPTRRDVLAGAVALAGAAAVDVAAPVKAAAAGAAPPPPAAATLIVASDRKALVDTVSGRVRGFTSGGIFTFKGIPYAASPDGAARFMPPGKPAPWAGVRSALWYGPTCPQGPRAGWSRDEEAFVFDSTKLAALTLAELGVSASQVDRLHAMPHARLLAAAQAAQRTMAPAGGAGGPGGLPRLRATDRAGLAAVVDGTVLPHHPFDPTAPALSAPVPMLIGSTLNEFANEIQTAGIEAINEPELMSRATAAYGDAAARVVDAYRAAYPGERPSETYSRISAAGQRFNAITQATRKAALGAAPAFLYWFTWQTPILDGRPRAFHCAELPFVFDNADRCAAMTGGTAEARELAGRVSDAWIAFARPGHPGHPGLPSWPAFTPERGEVMVFDRTCEMKNDPDRAPRGVIPTT